MFQKDSYLMQSTVPTLTMAIFGLMFLAQMWLTVSPTSQQVALIVPPWAVGGMAYAAGLNTPIIDMRWQGHVIILDVSHDPSAIERLQNAGFYLLQTNIRSGCAADEVA